MKVTLLAVYLSLAAFGVASKTGSLVVGNVAAACWLLGSQL